MKKPVFPMHSTYKFRLFLFARSMASLGRRTKILFLLLCVLLCLYGLSFLYRPSRTAAVPGRLVLEQDIQDTAELRFSVPLKAEPVEMGNMTLFKQGSRFYLRAANGTYPVRQEILSRFFALLSLERSFITVSAQPRDYAAYDIDDGHAAQISLVRHDGTILAELFFGTTDVLGSGRYVRTGRSTKVFLIDNALESFLTVAAPFWLDMQIYASRFRGTGIQGIEYGKDIIVRNEKNGAHFRNLEAFLEKFSCIDVYSAPALQSPQTAPVRLTLGDGTDLRFSFTPLQSGDYVFSDSRSSNAYLISGYTCSQLIRHLDTLCTLSADASPGDTP